MLESLSFDYAGKKMTFFPWLLQQPAGWLVMLAEIVARVRHDIVSRTLDEKIKISQTNEMLVLRAFKRKNDGSWFVDVRSKITVKLVKFPAWLQRIQEMLGSVLWPIFRGKGYGWMDFPSPNEDESFNMLTCGGNLVHVLGFFGIHAFVETQNMDKFPDPKLTYTSDPQLNVKQVLVGHNNLKQTFWITDQNRGDVIIPLMTNVQATLAISQLEFLPNDLPFETVLWGQMPVTIDKLIFQGSDTWGHIGDGRWVCIEKMQVTGLGSWKDRRLHISPEHWFYTCPPPVKGWTKGMTA